MQRLLASFDVEQAEAICTAELRLPGAGRAESSDACVCFARVSIFGEVALLRDTPRTATVRATGQVTVLTLERAELFSLLESAPELRRQFDEVMNARRSVESNVFGSAPTGDGG